MCRKCASGKKKKNLCAISSEKILKYSSECPDTQLQIVSFTELVDYYSNNWFWFFTTFCDTEKKVVSFEMRSCNSNNQTDRHLLYYHHITNLLHKFELFHPICHKMLLLAIAYKGQLATPPVWRWTDRILANWWRMASSKEYLRLKRAGIWGCRCDISIRGAHVREALFKELLHPADFLTQSGYLRYTRDPDELGFFLRVSSSACLTLSRQEDSTDLLHKRVEKKRRTVFFSLFKCQRVW